GRASVGGLRPRWRVGGSGAGPDGRHQRRAGFAYRARWSRLRQRSGRWCRRPGVRPHRYGSRRRGCGELPPHRGGGRAYHVSSTSGTPDPTASFELYRRRLLGLAYRMLGSLADAEDAVQETYVRWHGTKRDKVADPRAFLMTTTTRICLDALKSARAR